jgi:ATP-binding cassette subfamily C protein LapB
MNVMPPPEWWLAGRDAGALSESRRLPLFQPLEIPPDLAPRNDLTEMLGGVLAASGWAGTAEHLAEAMPHLCGAPDLTALRATLANLGFRTELRSRGATGLRPDELPAIVLPRRQPAELLFTDESGAPMRFVAGAAAAEPAPRLDRNGADVLRVVRAGPPRNPHARDSWVAAVLGRFRASIAPLLLASLVLALLALAVPFFIQAVFDMLIGGGTAAPLPMLLLGLSAALAFETMFRACRLRILARIGARIDSLMSSSAFERLLGLPLAMTERVGISAQVARVRDFSSVREFYTGSLAVAALDAPFALLLVAVLAIMGGPVAFAPIGAAAGFGLLFLLVRRKLRRAVSAAAVAGQERDQLAAEILSVMRLLRASAAASIWAERHRRAATEAAVSGARVAALSGMVASISQAITGLAALAAVGLGVHAVLAGAMTAGALIASMMVIWRVLGPIQLVFTILSRWEQVQTSIRQADQLMAAPAEREAGQVLRPVGQIRGDVALSRVSLRYLANGEPALLGVSAEIRAGQMVAIVGASGAGKTTLLLTIMGLHRASAGIVRIDGFDIRRFDPVELRRAIAYVPAVPQLLYGTIAQNLLLANRAAGRQAMLDAARLTGLDRLVGRLPEGFETRVKDNGALSLPASLLTRLSLTRALLRPARIVLLDEPANGLDEEGNEAMRKVIETLRGQATLFVVTHRPSHAAIADRVLRMQEGQLEELPRGPAAPAAPAAPTALPIRPATQVSATQVSAIQVSGA